MSTQEHFAVQLPPGFTVSKQTPAHDFDLFTVAKQGVPYVIVYIGNAPRFPRAAASPAQYATTFRAPGVEMYSVWENDELVRREVLLTLADSGWPTRLHAFFAANLGARDVQVADMILSSLSVGRPTPKTSATKRGQRDSELQRKTPNRRR